MKKIAGRAAALLLDTPLVWAALAFAAYFYYARFIVTVAWNAIELIIAQHLLEHGAYATSVDYPSSLTWRPLVPTLLVTFFRLLTSDPMLIYRLVCGTALAALTASMFLSARLLWSRTAAHAAAFFTVTCPAITLYLIDHAHSYSHLGMLLVLGPAILFSVRLFRPDPAGGPPTTRSYALAGFFWALAYLCRSELLLFGLLHFVLLLWHHAGQWRSVRRPLLAWLLVFSGIFGVYNAVASHVAARDGIVIRKTIYGFYISQGWSDPPPNLKPDIEADGYAYAIRLYGDPLANRESLVTAIRHNPAAFARRLQINFRAFYARYADPDFFPLWWSLLDLALLGLLLTGRLSRPDRLPVVFLFGLFAASHFILIFHIDARYLSITMPPLILLLGGLAHYLAQGLSRLPRPVGTIATVMLLGGLLYGTRPQFRHWRDHRAPNTQSLAAMESLGRHFRSVVVNPRLSPNREPHIGFFFPAQSPLYPEDQFLLGYFSHTAWVNRGAEGDFPRGKFYSFRDCYDDYQYVPADQIAAFGGTRSSRIIADYENPVLGRYYLLKMNP